MKAPKVSVIIPNYNHQKYLKERIDSVLNQTYQDYELLILDDKSPDDSMDVINLYKDHSHVSQIVCNEVNSGSTFKQWNKGISLAKGEYIWIAESDDVADPNLLQTLVDNLERTPNVVLSYCQSYRMNSNSEVIGDWVGHTADLNPELFASDFTMDGADFIKRYLKYKNVIPNASAVLFRKSTWSEVKGADEKVKYCSDWHFWMKLLTKGNVAFSAEKLNYFRFHDTSVIALAGKDAKGKEKYIFKYDILMRMALDDYLENNGCEGDSVVKYFLRERLCSVIRKESRFQLRNGRFPLAIHYLKLLIKYPYPKNVNYRMN